MSWRPSFDVVRPPGLSAKPPNVQRLASAQVQPALEIAIGLSYIRHWMSGDSSQGRCGPCRAAVGLGRTLESWGGARILNLDGLIFGVEAGSFLRVRVDGPWGGQWETRRRVG